MLRGKQVTYEFIQLGVTEPRLPLRPSLSELSLKRNVLQRTNTLMSVVRVFSLLDMNGTTLALPVISFSIVAVSTLVS